MAEPLIEIETSVSQELVDAWSTLVRQLSSSAPPPSAEELGEIVSSPACRLFVARLDGRIVGSLTLVLFRIPTGVRAWIEDVVVDTAARGAGVGAALNRAALVEAERFGAKTVDLTSRPSREEANRLYQRLGFKPRDTNVYRYAFEGGQRVRHATATGLDELEPLLEQLRAVTGLVERKRGVFYRRSKAFLHFHEDPADIRLAGDFERIRAQTPEERTALLERVRGLVTSGR